ncbi:MAG: alpha/beta fold hydrolase [Deltaproteobacteria bacterium]|nr:alpha/beta fold hydrolase [Deltaproteobacteria bacterium]
MVQRGQVLERMTVVRSGELALEALFASGVAGAERGGPVVLAGPHPRFGGNMDSPVLTELVWALARQGRPTLRFNWRGVGASQGDSRVPVLPAASQPTLDDETSDLVAAIEHHAGGERCSLVGYSFGAAPATRAAIEHPAVERLVLVAPLIDVLAFDWDALVASGVPTAIVCGELDHHAAADAVRKAAGHRLPIRVVAGAGHAFQRGLPELARAVAASL